MQHANSSVGLTQLTYGLCKQVNRVVGQDGTVSHHVVLPDGSIEMLLTEDESSSEDDNELVSLVLS